MTREDYLKDASERGYPAPVEKILEAGRVNAMHAHDGALYLLGLAGQMTVAYADETPDAVLRPGATVEVPAGAVHEERVGAEGARFLVAVRE